MQLLPGLQGLARAQTGAQKCGMRGRAWHQAWNPDQPCCRFVASPHAQYPMPQLVSLGLGAIHACEYPLPIHARMALDLL